MEGALGTAQGSDHAAQGSEWAAQCSEWAAQCNEWAARCFDEVSESLSRGSGDACEFRDNKFSFCG